MKKLFDETHGGNRTIWYKDDESDGIISRIFGEPDEWGGRMITQGDYSDLAVKLSDLIALDLQSVSEQIPSQTQWIFYSNIVDGDAIEDKVRFTLLVRLKDGHYSDSINMSDFIFSTSFDEAQKIKETIEAYLNNQNNNEES